MPLDLASLHARSAHVEIEVPSVGATIGVDYRPEKYTLGTVHAIQNLSGQDQVDKLVDILKDLIADWDITDDGTAVMVSADNLRRLPMLVLNGILRGIASDVGDQESSKNGRRR